MIIPKGHSPKESLILTTYRLTKYSSLRVTEPSDGRAIWVFLIPALKGKYVALEDSGNGIWQAYYRDVFLGFFDERYLRNKDSPTRLETNLVQGQIFNFCKACTFTNSVQHADHNKERVLRVHSFFTSRNY